MDALEAQITKAARHHLEAAFAVLLHDHEPVALCGIHIDEQHPQCEECATWGCDACQETYPCKSRIAAAKAMGVML